MSELHRQLANSARNESPIKEPTGQLQRSAGTRRHFRGKYDICEFSEDAVATECYCVQFSTDAKKLAACFGDGSIGIYATEGGKQDFLLMDPQERSGASLSRPLPAMKVRWRPTDAGTAGREALVSVSADINGEIRHWDPTTGKCSSVITESGNSLFALDFTHEGSHFATAGIDKLIRVYDEATEQLVETLGSDSLMGTPSVHSNRVFCLKFHPQDPNVLCSGGWDNTVQVWDRRANANIRTLWNCIIRGDSIDFSDGGSKLLTASCRHEDPIQLWDLATGEVVGSLPCCGSTASSKSPTKPLAATFSKDETMVLVGGTQDDQAMFIDCYPDETPNHMADLVGLQKSVYAVDFCVGDRMAAVGCADGTIRVIEVR